MAFSLGRTAGGLGGFGCVDLAWMNWLRRWLLAVPAAVLLQLCPSRACTVYDLYSHGLAASLWHMIPASVLFADNGTFFVRPQASKVHSPSLQAPSGSHLIQACLRR